MSEVTRLLLVRHTQPKDEARGHCYGTLDIGLSAHGEAHAQALARTLERIPLSAIYTSPRQRAVDTAAPLAAVLGLTSIVDDALCEIDFGDFEGQSYDAIERSHPDLYRQWMETPTRVQFPGGESYAALRVRALEALNAIRMRHNGGTVAVVSHGGVLRAMLAECLSIPDEAIFRIDQSYGAISIVDWIDTVPLVRLLNAQSVAGVVP
jgi:alpha-ribazole phosphatase